MALMISVTLHLVGGDRDDSWTMRSMANTSAEESRWWRLVTFSKSCKHCCSIIRSFSPPLDSWMMALFTAWISKSSARVCARLHARLAISAG
jgi:hypothetical protein